MNIKKIVAALTAAICAAVLSATDIETALQQTADQFSASIKRGTTIAIVGISSDSAEMSDFMLDDLTMRFVQARVLTVANRANLDAIKTEMNFQLSGEVSDESIQQLGAMVGAKVVVHGKLIPLGNAFNLTVQALNVETAAVIDMCRIRVEPNATTDYLLASNKRGMPRGMPKNTKYSGDFQVKIGYRGATCYGHGASGFYLGGANYNLFNINKVFSVGFFEEVSGSLGPLSGFDFVIGPAIGLYVANAVKLQAGFGYSAGMDYGEIEDDYYVQRYIESFPWGIAFQVMAKFLPSKRVSPIVTFQYEWKDGAYKENYHYYDDDKEYAGFHAFNITAGISINFGKRAR